jgi:tRNA pseudouridine55 synthase
MATNGLLLIDKPAGCTSHDVVNRVRKVLAMKHVGHLGTLDPMATGLLALLTGTATRLAPFYAREDKTYEAVIQFGVTSDTYDSAGEITATGVASPLEADIRSALEAFRGRFFQVPPPISAKKVGGVAAYKLVRKRMPVNLKPVEVEVKDLVVRGVTKNSLAIEVTCSAGTYIRSLAHDLGQRLGSGAILAGLRRTRVGALSLADAVTLEELTERVRIGDLNNLIIPAGELLAHLPAERVSTAVEVQIRHGRQFRTSPFTIPPGSPLVRVLSRSGELIAIGKLIIPNLYHPSTVFQPEMAR